MKNQITNLFKKNEIPSMENQVIKKCNILPMKEEIVEFRKSVEKIAQEHLQEEEKLRENFKNASKEIISSIKSEREKLVKKQADTEAELKRTHIQINLKKQQYNKSMQESDEEKTKGIERELLELTGQENVLALRKDAFSKIDGCDNEHTKESFNRLYNLYIGTKENEGKIHKHYKEILEELESLKKTLEKEVEEIEHINRLYDMENYGSSIEHTYTKNDVVEAFEIIHGKIKVPREDTWNVHVKMRAVNEFMAKRQG